MKQPRTRAKTEGLFVGQSEYRSLPAQQKEVEEEILGSRYNNSIDEKQRAQQVLNQRLKNHQVMPADGAAAGKNTRPGIIKNSQSAADQKGSQQNLAAQRKPKTASQRRGGGRAGGPAGNALNIDAIQNLDRKTDHPGQEWAQAVPINDSPYKDRYDKVNQRLLGEEDGPYRTISNDGAYFYGESKIELRGPRAAATFTRLEPMHDNEAFQCLQNRAYVGVGDEATALHKKWIDKDFPDRNLALKKTHLKPMATEDSIDDWYAQSLGIPYDKFLRQKRMLQSIMTGARRKNQQSQPKPKAPKAKKNTDAKNAEKAKKITAENKTDRIDYDSMFTKSEGPSSVSGGTKPKNQTIKRVRPVESPSLGASQPNVDFGQLLKNVMGHAKNKIKEPGDLKPLVYSRFSKMRSEATSQGRFSEKAAAIHQSSPHKNQRLALDDEQASQFRQNQALRDANLQQGVTIERRALISEVGGFGSRKVLNTYYQQLKDRRQLQRSQPTKPREVNQEFLKQQKQKLKELMLQNIDLEFAKRERQNKQGNGPQRANQQNENQQKERSANAINLSKIDQNMALNQTAQSQQNRKRMSASALPEAQQCARLSRLDGSVPQAGLKVCPGGRHQRAQSQLNVYDPVDQGQNTYSAQPPSATHWSSGKLKNRPMPDQRSQSQTLNFQKFNIGASTIGKNRLDMTQKLPPTIQPSSAMTVHGEGPQHIRIRSGNSPSTRASVGYAFLATGGYSASQELPEADMEINRHEEEKQEEENKKSSYMNPNQHDIESLRKFWLTDHQSVLGSNQENQKEESQGAIVPAGVPGDDASQHWYLMDKRLGEQQMYNSVAEHQLATVHQGLDEVSSQLSIKDSGKPMCPIPQLSVSENEYFSLTKSLKGVQMSSQYHKYIARVMQEKCFDNLKNDTIQQMLQKQGFKTTKGKTAFMSSKAISNGSAEGNTMQTSQDPDSARNIPEGDSERHRYILKQIELDNFRDISEPFVVLNTDSRVHKINKKPHVAKPDQKLKKKKLDFQDAEYWFLKGYDHAECNEMDSAIDSYRQAIRLDTNHAEAMMNLAAQYESQQRYVIAIKWYSFAIKINPELLDAYYGYALCQFKDGKPQDAADHLSTAVTKLGDPDQNQSPKEIKERKVYFRYLRSLCYKVLGQFDKSQKDYTDILRTFELAEGSKFANYIFTMILMPIETNRKKLLQYVDGFAAVLGLFEAGKDRRILSQYYLEYIDKNNVYISDNKHPKWRDAKIPEVIRILRGRSFFKRFSLPRLCEILDRMELKLIPARDLLFFRPDEVYVVVSGNIVMKNHDAQIELPATCAKFGEGDVLNFLQEGSPIYHSLETWFFSQVESEVAVFDRAYFQKMWEEDIMTEKLMLQRSLTASQPLFNRLSKLTTMMLVSEVFQYKRFRTGQVIMCQSKYSPTNTYFRQYYEIRLSKFAEELRAKKTKQEIGAAMSRSPGLRPTTAPAIQAPPERPSPTKPPALAYDTQESIEKSGKVAQKYNFKSRKKANLEKELGLNDVSPSGPQGKALFDDAASDGSRDAEEVQLIPSSGEREKGGKGLRHMGSGSETGPNDMFSPFSGQTQEGLYFITRGCCVVRNHDDQHVSKKLKQGDFFGESDLLKCIGYTFFGEIAADSNDVECWFIPADQFWKIPLFEQVHMKEKAKDRRDILMLSFEYARKYTIDMQEYASYYA